MTAWEKLEKQIHDTYHDPKNKEVLPIVIFFSVIFLLFKGSVGFELLLWAGYYSYCKSNNEKLNSNKRNLERREILLNVRRKIISGELEFPDKSRP